ncbi:MAG: hypothetical protein HGA71_20780, partial [Azonexaceae bacterium]|nr:hypothetical protein [Azonexaceae bacterium]
MEDITSLLGGHVQFLAGSGQHLRFTRQGKLRMLIVVNQEERNPDFADVPTLKELGCNDLPGLSLIVVAPKGLSESVRKKLEDSLKKASEQASFQKVLKFLDMKYIYRGGKELETYLQSEMESNRSFLKTMGVDLKELKN